MVVQADRGSEGNKKAESQLPKAKTSPRALKRTGELVDVESVDLSVGLGVLEEAEEKLSRLDGPATLDDSVLLGLGGTSNGTVVAAEGDALPVGLDVLEVGDGLGELEVVKGSGGLAGGQRRGQLERIGKGRAATAHRVFL